jgi:hypothetical protein
MAREEDILSAIDDISGFDFQEFACRLLQRERYTNLNPLPDQDDLGQDARTDELPITELPDLDRDPDSITFAISKTTTKTKLTDDCDRCRDVGHEIDTFVFVTSGEVTNNQRKSWKEDVQDEYSWDLVIYDRTWFSNIVTKPDHEKLIEEQFGIPPLGGDYYYDIVERFDQITNRTLSSITGELPQLGKQLDREAISRIQSEMTTETGVVISGEAGVGKTGVLQQVVENWRDSPVLFVDTRRFSECSTPATLRQVFDLNGTLSEAIERIGRYEQCLVVLDQLDNIGGTPAAGVFAEVIEEILGAEGVSVLVSCREYELKYRNEYAFLTDSDDFSQVTISTLPDGTVEQVLDELEIVEYSEELVQMGRNLLNLSIIAELKAADIDVQINFSEVKTQVELWDQYQESLVKRETIGGGWDEKSGEEVRARAIELAQSGLRDGSRAFPISLRRERADKRLISRNVLKKEFGDRYSFRHDELQDYFYAWDAVNRHGWTTPQQVLDDIDEHVATGVFQWMLRLLLQRGNDPASEFISNGLSSDGLNYYAASQLIDEITTWDPNDVDDEILELTLDKIETREELCNYFYETLSDPTWVDVHRHQGRFDEPHSPLLRYLDNVATSVPEDVVEIIETTSVEQEHKRAFLIQIAEQLPSEYAAQTADRFQEWLPDATVGVGPYNIHYTNFIGTLLQKDEPDVALDLLDALLEPQEPNPEIIELGLETRQAAQRTFRSEATALADIHAIERVIETVEEELPSGYEEEFIDILEENLREAIRLEAEVREVPPGEFTWPSMGGRMDLHNTKLREVLHETLQNHLRKWISDDPNDETRRSLLSRYLDDMLVFRQLALSYLRSCPKVYDELVRVELLHSENYDDPRIQYEFFTLLRDAFSILDDDDKQQVLEIIGQGISAEEAKERSERLDDKFPDRSIDEIAKFLDDRWKLKRFWMIRKDLPPDYRDHFEELVEEYEEPENPEKVIEHTSGAVSFEGPIDPEELGELPPEEILELCVEWDPSEEESEDFLTEISPQGLGDDLKTEVEQAPETFVPHLELLSEADSIYIYHVFDGLEDVLDDGRSFDWGPVLSLCDDVVDRTDSWGRETKTKTCRLLKTGIQETDLLQHHAEDVRDLLIALSDDSDPGLEEGEPEFIPHENPIRTAINSVRPVAVNALIVYGLNKADLDGFEGFEEEQESGFEPQVYEALLERLSDPSTAVHSVFGQRIVNLRWLDADFVSDNLDTIFPIDNTEEATERFDAAWSAYLSVTRWQSDIYSWLREYYFHAIDLHVKEGRFGGHNEGRGLVAHTLCAYIGEYESLEDDDSLITYFYENISPDTAGDASWQLMRWGNDQSEFKEHWNKVRALWEWRLDQVSRDSEAHRREFEWFIEWLDIVDEQVEPSEIQQLTIETFPMVSSRSRVWDTVEDYLTKYIQEDPLTGIQIYSELVDQPVWPNFRTFNGDTRKILESALEQGGEPRDIARETTESIAESDTDYLGLLDQYSID